MLHVGHSIKNASCGRPIYGAERLTWSAREVGQTPIKGPRHTNHNPKPDPDPKCPNPPNIILFYGNSPPTVRHRNHFQLIVIKLCRPYTYDVRSCPDVRCAESRTLKRTISHYISGSRAYIGSLFPLVLQPLVNTVVAERTGILSRGDTGAHGAPHALVGGGLLVGPY